MLRRRRRRRHRRRGGARAAGVRRRRRSSWARCSATSSRRARRSGVSFGRALGVEHAGRGGGAGGVRRAAVPALGPKLALLLIALGLPGADARRAWRRRRRSWVPAAGALGLALLAPPLAFVDIPRRRARRQLPGRRHGRGERGRRRRRRRAPAHQQPAAGRQQRDAARGRAASLAARCCSTRRPGARCSSAWAPASRLRRRPRIRRCDVDAVELLPEVIAASTHFTRRFGAPRPARVRSPPMRAATCARASAATT